MSFAQKAMDPGLEAMGFVHYLMTTVTKAMAFATDVMSLEQSSLGWTQKRSGLTES